MITACVTDDSPTVQRILKRALEREGDIKVLSISSCATECWQALEEHNPDVLTLDVHMPGQNGLDLLSDIMKERPIPVVMVSSLNARGSGIVLEAMSRGAFDCIEKPSTKELMGSFEESLRASVRLANLTLAKQKAVSVKDVPPADALKFFMRPAAIGIAASTGGLKSTEAVLTKLPKNSPPIVITQHMRDAMMAAMANNMNQKYHFDVKLAEDGEVLRRGMVRIAPPKSHLVIESSYNNLMCKLIKPSDSDHIIPAADPMMHSLSQLSPQKAVGVVLSGMGDDGAKGLLAIKSAGNLCLTETETSCTVYGMSKAAVELGASNFELSADAIGNTLKFLQ